MRGVYLNVCVKCFACPWSDRQANVALLLLKITHTHTRIVVLFSMYEGKTVQSTLVHTTRESYVYVCLPYGITKIPDGVRAGGVLVLVGSGICFFCVCRASGGLNCDRKPKEKATNINSKKREYPEGTGFVQKSNDFFYATARNNIAVRVHS